MRDSLNRPRLRGIAILFSILLVVLTAAASYADVVVFGPRTYTLSDGAPEIITAPISVSACDAHPDAVFTLEVVNGDTAGGHRVSSGTIAINGNEIVGDSDFNQQAALITKTIVLQMSGNSIAVTLKGGKPAASIAVTLRRHIDVTIPVFAAKKYVAASNGTQTFHDVFTADALTDPFTLLVNNGVDGAPAVSSGNIVLNGVEIVSSKELVAGKIEKTVTLQASNDLAVTLSGSAGQALSAAVLRHPVDASGPEIVLNGLTEGQPVGTPTLVVSGRAVDPSGVASLSLNGTALTLGADGAFSTTVTLAGGPNTLKFDAVDCNGNGSHHEVTVILSTAPPQIAITAPAADTIFTSLSVPVSGTATDAYAVTSVTVNGQPATLNGSNWTATVVFPNDGKKTLTAVATNIGGKTATATLPIVVDVTPPVIVASFFPQPNAADWIAGSVEVSFDCGDGESGLASCIGTTRISTEGAGQIANGTATDRAGHSHGATVVVNIDKTAPQLAIDPLTADGSPAVVKGTSVTLNGSVSDALSGLKSITCSGIAATVTNGRFRCTVPVDQWATIDVRATDRADNIAYASVPVFTDNTPPSVTITSPKATDAVTGNSVVVTGYAGDDRGAVTLTINGVAVPVVNGAFSTTVPLVEGSNPITAVATDAVGNTATATVTIDRFFIPNITIASPADLSVVSSATITVSGTVNVPGLAVTVNGVQATVSGTSFAAVNVPLQQGRTVINAVATTPAGRTASANIFIYRDSIPPRVTPIDPPANATVYTNAVTVIGKVDDVVVGTVNSQQVTLTVGGVPATVANCSFVARGVPLQSGANDVVIAATDHAGNVTTVHHPLTYTPLPALPHLVSVAGDGQSGAIGATLPVPLQAQFVDGNGQAIANAPLELRVAGDRGTLTSGASSGRVINVVTDAQGRVAATWKLGTRAGAAVDRVEVRATSSVNYLELSATTIAGPPSLIVVDAGNSQFGAVSQHLPRPFVAVVVDSGSNRLANVPVVFSVLQGGGSFDGQPSVTVTTDSDGRAVATAMLGPDAGNDNNVFAAATPQGARVEFVASGRRPGDPAATRIFGVVEDNMNVPISGVSVRIDGTAIATQTDAQGQFVLGGVPIGYVKLFVDGTTAQRAGTWPTLEYAMYTVAGIDNRLEMPIYLLPIDVRRGLFVDDITGGTLTLPELPGFSLTVKPGTATFPGGGRTGTVSATLVHNDKVPMTPGFGQQPRFIVTIQPTGTHFDPPAALSIPNTDGLAPGEVTEMYSFDHDLGQFVSIGSGTVSDDGSTIRSDPGTGIIKGGWHTGGNPAPQGNAKSINVIIRPSQDSGGIGQTIDVVATGSPAAGGSYSNWQVDNGSVAHFTNQPACSGQGTCTAKLQLDSDGTANVTVSFSANGKTVTSAAKKVTVAKFRVQAAQFINSETFSYDRISVGLLPIPPTQWSLGGTSYPVWYAATKGAVSGAPTNLQVKIELKIDPPLTSPLTTQIQGQGNGFTLAPQTVTIPSGASNFWISTPFISNETFPKLTTKYPSFELTWTAQQTGGTPTDIGKTTNEMYVTLTNPSPGSRDPIAFTVLQLAVGDGGAIDQVVALAKTWTAFAKNSNGTPNVHTWDGVPLTYYSPAFVNDDPSVTPTSTAAELLFVGNGQCRTFVDLLRLALLANGVSSTAVRITSTQNSSLGLGPPFRMIVKEFTTSGLPSPLTGEYTMQFDPASTASHWMWPARAVYGDLTNASGVPGQNTDTPETKIFGDHVILQTSPVGGIPDYYDPSYGVRWNGPADFQANALFGFGTSWDVVQHTMSVAPQATRLSPAVQFEPIAFP